MYKRQKIETALLSGEIRCHYVLPYEKVQLAHEAPGIYSWHIRYKEGINFIEFNNFFKHISLKAKVSGNLRLEYEGDLRKKFPEYDNPINTELFTDFTFSLAYPIYIGISKNLKYRLSTHRRQFEEALEGSLIAKRDQFEDGTMDDDTDEESSYFGGRLAYLWPKHLPRHCLYVKYAAPRKCISNNCYFCCEDENCLNEIYTDLRWSEKVGNDLFNPVFGRR